MSGNGTSPGGSGWLPAVSLVAFAVVAAALLANVDRLTRARIADNETANTLKRLESLLPGVRYDNALHRDVTHAQDADLLGSPDALPVYRARVAGEPVAVIMTAIAPNGYVGSIRLLVSVDVDGQLLGVRAVAHTETPGLGDRIDADKSDWILGFDGRSLEDPAAMGWRLQRDGGAFDQLTGATITSRAVVMAVHDALHYFERHRTELLAPPELVTEES